MNEGYYKINTCEQCFMHFECKKGCPGSFINNLPIYTDAFCSVRKTSILNCVKKQLVE